MDNNCAEFCGRCGKDNFVGGKFTEKKETNGELSEFHLLAAGCIPIVGGSNTLDTGILQVRTQGKCFYMNILYVS